jgi:hypothetical protein
VFSQAAEADVVVYGGIARQGEDYSVLLRLSSSHGESMGRRELESPGANCSSLDDSLALVMAVMLDIPKARVPPPPPKAGTDSSSAQAPTPPKQTVPPELSSKLRLPKDVTPKRPQWHYDFVASASAKLGLLPEPALGVTLRLAVAPPNFWRIALDFGWYTRAEEESAAGTGASFSPLELGLFICPLELRGLGLSFEGCLMQHFGRLQVQAFGFDENLNVTRTFVNVGVTLGIRATLSGPLFVRLAVTGETPVIRETFRYGASSGETPSLFRMAPVVAQGQIGLGAEF